MAYRGIMDGENDLRVELNLALVPNAGLADRFAAVSWEFARRYPAVVRLGDGNARLSLAPHLTLYQVAVPLAGLAELHEGLRKVAWSARCLSLACTGLAYNAAEASLEARTSVPEALGALQGRVIGVANSLRGNLLPDRDPAGNRVAELLTAQGVLGDNIRRVGYAEVGDARTGGLFRPHVTLNWFEPGTEIDVAREDIPVGIGALGGEYPALAMFAMGPYGTCPQRLASYEFSR